MRNSRMPLATIAVISIATLIGVGTSAAWTILQMRSGAAWVEHTLEVINVAESALASTIDIETATRGYMVTGREDYLAPFFEGRAAVVSDMKSLRSLTIDNPSQGHKLN